MADNKSLSAALATTTATTGSDGGAGAEVVARKREIKALVEAHATALAESLPAGMTVERLARLVFTQMTNTPRLLECTNASLVGAILTCAQLGMEPGLLGEAWLVPYRNTKTGVMEAQFQLGYLGMVKLFWQHPLASYIDAETVYENDEFTWSMGLHPDLRHVRRPGPRGAPTGWWYSVARLHGGGYAFQVMDRAEVQEHRMRSNSPNSPAWTKDYNAMAQKTCVRQMFKFLPKSVTANQALAQDGLVRTDLGPGGIDVVPPFPTEAVVSSTGAPADPGSPDDPDAVTPRLDPVLAVAGPKGYTLADIAEAAADLYATAVGGLDDESITGLVTEFTARPDKPAPRPGPAAPTTPPTTPKGGRR